MNFCSQCAAPVVLRIPPGDDRPRHVCDACGTIHYQNPKIVAGCIPEYEGRILLCRRAIEPRSGFWTLPAGFMENGETTEEAAVRETREEANARVEVDALFTCLDIPRINQVYVMFRGPRRRRVVLAGRGESGYAPVRGSRGAVGRDRVSGHHAHPGALVPGPPQRCVRDPYRCDPSPRGALTDGRMYRMPWNG